MPRRALLWGTGLILLGAFLLFASVLTPWAVALALRISVE